MDNIEKLLKDRPIIVPRYLFNYYLRLGITAEELIVLIFIIDKGDLPFKNGDYLYIPGIKKAVEEKATDIKAFVVGDTSKEFNLKLGEMTDDERTIILQGCLINYYKG